MTKFVLWLIRLYQRLPLTSLHLSCRYTPTCSEYAYQSLAKYGILKGSFLALSRLLRCHPWHFGGYDPLV